MMILDKKDKKKMTFWLLCFGKVDKCMARLQELQYTVAGGKKVISGVSLSPRSTRGYMRTSLRCKQESLRCDFCLFLALFLRKIRSFCCFWFGFVWIELGFCCFAIQFEVSRVVTTAGNLHLGSFQQIQVSLSLSLSLSLFFKKKKKHRDQNRSE